MSRRRDEFLVVCYMTGGVMNHREYRMPPIPTVEHLAEAAALRWLDKFPNDIVMLVRKEDLP